MAYTNNRGRAALAAKNTKNTDWNGFGVLKGSAVKANRFKLLVRSLQFEELWTSTANGFIPSITSRRHSRTIKWKLGLYQNSAPAPAKTRLFFYKSGQNPARSYYGRICAGFVKFCFGVTCSCEASL